jgi:hypothetical protein
MNHYYPLNSVYIKVPVTGVRDLPETKIMWGAICI